MVPYTAELKNEHKLEKLTKYDVNDRIEDVFAEDTLKQLGFINDNPGLENENNNKFYHDENDILKKEEIHRCFNNKVTVNLCNGETKLGHLIHWAPEIGFFCISLEKWWDQFD